MSKYIKLFDNTEDYLDTLDEIKASEEGLRVLVSRCEPQEEGDRPTIHYDIYPGVLVTYNVSSITGDTKLCTTTNYRTVEIDSENEDVKYTDYKFSSKGEHLVRFRGFNTNYAIDDDFFKECTKLTGFVLDEGIISLRINCFDGCTGLKFINIPKTVKSIGGITHNPFINCSSLIKITVDENNPYFDSRNDFNAIIETATNKLVTGCMNTVIPNDIVTIRDEAFWGCSGLKSIGGVGSGAQLILPDSVTSIENYAFYACKNIKSLNIPSTVTSISYFAFVYNAALTRITVDSGNPIYDSRNDCNAIIETAENSLLKGCRNTIIPNDITTIGKNAFHNCPSLRNIVIPNSVTKIDDYAFNGAGLRNVSLPNSITYIGKQSFESCYFLESFVIPESVTTIGDNAFRNSSETYNTKCTYYVNATTPPTLGQTAFTKRKVEAIYVPSESVEAYKTAPNWSNYADLIMAATN